MSKLLGITLSDGRVFTKATNPSTALNPIELPQVGETVADIVMLIPAGGSTIPLNTLIASPNNYWADDDGDGNVNVTGSLSVSIKDANDNIISRTDTMSPCHSPYAVTLTSSAGILSTQYGEPRTTSFTGDSATYYIRPKIVAPYACFARPNLNYNGGVANTGNYNGPSSQWDYTKGFILQNINTPASNFPTMGAHGLYFNLIVAGVSGSGVTYQKRAGGSPNVNLNLTDIGYGVKVELVGPKHGSTAAQAAFTPTTFEFYAGVTKLYSFTLSKWFIVRPGTASYDPDTKNYCGGLGYNVPSIGQYTNSNGLQWTGGLVNQNSNYQRRIGGGLFAEWGVTRNVYYTGSDFDSAAYWARESYNSANQYRVSAYNGVIGYLTPSIGSQLGAMCVSP